MDCNGLRPLALPNDSALFTYLSQDAWSYNPQTEKDLSLTKSGLFPPLQPWGMKSCEWCRNWNVANLWKALDDGMSSYHLPTWQAAKTKLLTSPPEWGLTANTCCHQQLPKVQLCWLNLLGSVCLTKVLFSAGKQTNKDVQGINADMRCFTFTIVQQGPATWGRGLMEIQNNNSHMDPL